MLGASVPVDRELGARSHVRRRRFRDLGLVLAGCLIGLLVAGSAGATDPTFTPAPGSPVAAGSKPESVAAADLNGDGRLDLAVASAWSADVTILLGDGAGGFSAAPGSPVPVGSFPTFVAAADLNGDGKPDLAVVNDASHNVSILLGDGSGGFAAAPGSPVAVGVYPISLAAAELNGDGKLDLAVANSESDDVSILLGNGSGGFSSAQGSPVAAGDYPHSVAAADLNGDGKRDLAVANFYSDDLTILLGNGSGGFSAAPGSPVFTGAGPVSLVAADLNEDGKPDLAVANYRSNDVDILLGNGSGGFGEALGSPVAAGDGPASVAAADLNGDGKPDLAVANNESNDVSILLGNGTGAFHAATGSPVAAGGSPISVAAADLNEDGKRDLAVANYGSNNVTILLNSTTPTAVALQSVTARPTRQGLELRWRTVQEASLLGFNVYRSGVRLNRALIGARGAVAGAAYRLLDRRARVGVASTYQLQAVRIDGTRVWIGKTTARR